MDVETFLNWLLAAECESLRDRNNGLLTSWVHDLLSYESPASETRVKARWRKWLTSGPGNARTQMMRKEWAENAGLPAKDKAARS